MNETTNENKLNNPDKVFTPDLHIEKPVLDDDSAIRNIFSSVFATLLKSLGMLPRSPVLLTKSTVL